MFSARLRNLDGGGEPGVAACSAVLRIATSFCEAAIFPHQIFRPPVDKVVEIKEN